MQSQKVIIQSIEPPAEPRLAEDMLWLCKSFGFMGSRDKDETSSKIFNAIVTARAAHEKLTSSQIADKSHVTRAAALYHLNNYMSSGIVIEDHATYLLRTRSLQKTIEEIELDVMRMFSQLKKIAAEIDEQLGMKAR